MMLLIVPFLVENVSQRRKHYSNAFFRGNKIYQHLEISTDKELSPHGCWLGCRLVGYEVLNVVSFRMPEERSRDLLLKTYYGIVLIIRFAVEAESSAGHRGVVQKAAW